MKGKYLNPKADLTFKKVFGEHEQLTLSLLNALLPLDEGKQIEHLEFIPTELVPENPMKKNSVVDVRCHETGGREFIVEMQLNWNNEFKNRVILNAAKAVVKQLDKGEDYTLIKPVYSLNFINDLGFDTETDRFYHDYALVDVADTDRHLEGLRFVFVELKKFKPQSIMERKMAVLWLRFLTEIDEHTAEAPAELLANPDTSRALHILEKSAYTEAQLYTYEQFWYAVVNERVLIEGGYKKGRAEGLQQGIQQGLQQGIQQGLQQGIQQGIQQGEQLGGQKKAVAIARSLKAKGIPIDIISESTGLTVEEIAQLEKQ